MHDVERDLGHGGQGAVMLGDLIDPDKRTGFTVLFLHESHRFAYSPGRCVIQKIFGSSAIRLGRATRYELLDMSRFRLAMTGEPIEICPYPLFTIQSSILN
jgi:hypothetical protein